jgi:outer membrane receptor for monomeric catechols
MPARLLRTVAMALVAIALCDAALAAGKRPRHSVAAGHEFRDDLVTPYRPHARSTPRPSELDTPGQTTVLTRQMLDDMNATTLRDALRSTAGVTVGP